MTLTEHELTNITVELLTRVVGCPVDVSSSRENTTEWDSLNHLKLLLELNERFKIRIPFEDYGKLNSVQDIVRFLHRIVKF